MAAARQLETSASAPEFQSRGPAVKIGDKDPAALQPPADVSEVPEQVRPRVPIADGEVGRCDDVNAVEGGKNISAHLLEPSG
jgi:hypothetical protein